MWNKNSSKFTLNMIFAVFNLAPKFGGASELVIQGNIISRMNLWIFQMSGKTHRIHATYDFRGFWLFQVENQEWQNSSNSA